MFYNFDQRAGIQQQQKQPIVQQVTPSGGQTNNPNLLSYIDQILTNPQNNKGLPSPTHPAQRKATYQSTSNKQDNRFTALQGNNYKPLIPVQMRGSVQENPIISSRNNSQIQNQTMNNALNMNPQNHEYNQFRLEDRNETISSVRYQDNSKTNHNYSQSLNVSNSYNVTTIDLQNNAINKQSNLTQTQKRPAIQVYNFAAQPSIQFEISNDETPKDVPNRTTKSQTLQIRSKREFQQTNKQNETVVSKISKEPQIPSEQPVNSPTRSEGPTQSLLQLPIHQILSTKNEQLDDQRFQLSMNSNLHSQAEGSINQSTLGSVNQGLAPQIEIPSIQSPYLSSNQIISHRSRYNQVSTQIEKSNLALKKSRECRLLTQKDKSIEGSHQRSINLELSSHPQKSKSQRLLIKDENETNQSLQRSTNWDQPSQSGEFTEPSPLLTSNQEPSTYILQSSQRSKNYQPQSQTGQNNQTSYRSRDQQKLNQDQLENKSQPAGIDIPEKPYQTDRYIQPSQQPSRNKYLPSRTEVSNNRSPSRSINLGQPTVTEDSPKLVPLRSKPQVQQTKSTLQVYQVPLQVQKVPSQVQKINDKQDITLQGPNQSTKALNSKEYSDLYFISQNTVLKSKIIPPINKIYIEPSPLIQTDFKRQDQLMKCKTPTATQPQTYKSKYQNNRKANTEQLQTQNKNNPSSSSSTSNLLKKSPLKILNPRSSAPSSAPTQYPGFEVQKFLGKGKFSEVYLARHKLANFQVALKVISKATVIEMDMQGQLSWEIKVQLVLSHPNIVKLFTFFQNETSIILVLEHCGDGELYEVMKSQPGKRFKELDAVRYVKQVNSALAHLHFNDVIHRDIKPENILLSFGEVKLADFSFCIYSPCQTRQTQCGTMVYSSPEVVTGLEYDRSSDMWSLGVLAYELCDGKTPWEDKSREDAIIMITTTEIKGPSHFSEKLKSYISSLTKKIPRERLNARQAINHPWLTQVRIEQSIFKNEDVLN